VLIKNQLSTSAALSAPLGCIFALRQGERFAGQPKPAATFKSTWAPRERRGALLKWRFEWNDPLRYFAFLKARAGWLKIGAHDLFGEGPIKAQFKGNKITKIRGGDQGFCPRFHLGSAVSADLGRPSAWASSGPEGLIFLHTSRNSLPFRFCEQKQHLTALS